MIFDGLPLLRPGVDTYTGPFCEEGWITREGKWLPVTMECGHAMAAWLALGGAEGRAELRAERLGWLRISNYGDRTCKPLNQAQITALWDWCQAMGRDYAAVMAGIKIL